MWRAIPGAPLESILDSTARLNIWHGPVRSGKTVTSLQRWVEYVVREAPTGGLLVMIGKTEAALERNILKPLADALGRDFRYSMGRHAAWLAGREIVLLGANDERAESKIRGATFAGVYGDELTLWPEGFFRMTLSRLSVRNAKLFGTTNPDGPYHWLKRDFIDRRGELDLAAFTWPLEANTTLDPAYVASLKAEYGIGTLWYRRFIDGQWVAAEGAVYDFFNEDEHVIPEAPAAPERLFLSIDYGTSNATSAGLYGAWSRPLPCGLRAVRLDGYYYDGRATGRQKTDAEYADDLEAKFGALKSQLVVILDPSAASFRAELRRRGWRVRDAVNDVIDGIRTQARMLRAGEYKLVNVPGNRQAISDYGAYLWDSKAQARGEDKPLKQNDHTKDDERYFLHTVFGFGAGTASDAARAAVRARA